MEERTVYRVYDRIEKKYLSSYGQGGSHVKDSWPDLRTARTIRTRRSNQRYGRKLKGVPDNAFVEIHVYKEVFQNILVEGKPSNE